MADKLSDGELIQELKKFGEEVKQPIDRRKRPILVKKLNHLRARENVSSKLKKTLNSRKKQNVEFSSEDESEVEDVSAPVASSRSSGRKSMRHHTSAITSTTDTIEISPVVNKTNLRSRRSLTTKQQSVVNSSNTPGPSVSSRLYPDLTRFKKETDYDYKADFSDTDPEESIYEVENKSINTTFPLAMDHHDGAGPADEEDDDDDDDFLNDNRDYNTRFSATRLNNRNVSNNVSQVKKTKLSNHVNSLTEEEIRQFGFKTHEDSRKMKSPVASYISTGLLVIVAVFFLSLGMTYIYMRGDFLQEIIHGRTEVQTTNDGFHINLKKCNSNNNDKDEDTKSCYTKEDMNLSLQLVSKLETYLATRAGEYETYPEVKEIRCGISIAKTKCFEILDSMLKEGERKDEYKEKIFNGTLTLIVDNPSWNIRVFSANDSPAKEMGQIATLETDPALPFMTRVYRALYKILVGVILLLTCVVFMMIGLMVLRHHKKVQEEERRKVFEIVEKIIDMVKENYNTNQEDSRHPPYMAVQHVRDQLLPPSQRRNLLPLWEKAVKFIEANESRIRVETQIIQGEDFIVWRWLPIERGENRQLRKEMAGEISTGHEQTNILLRYNTGPVVSNLKQFSIAQHQTNANSGKVWQGQAFGENNVSAGNTLHYSPTPCLKIRNMFDADVETEDNWDVSVQDAVLEKCKGITGILHIYVDRTSSQGCVYMKCNSCETAYQVYRSLHGWWFDGRLVTVKYLRLELYHDRFPNSKRATKPLKPSNNSMSSLSHPFHRSLLEMT